VVVGTRSTRQVLNEVRPVARRTLAALVVIGTAVAALAGGSMAAPAITGTPTSGTPIRVATIGDFDANGVDNSQWIEAVRARFDAANARGGLMDASRQRHPVQVIACNAASDPDQTARCAQQAVDQGAVAVVGLSAVYDDRALPILSAAHIPALGVRVNGETDATNPASFPIASGLEAELLAMPQLLAFRGSTKVAVIISDFGTATDDALAVLREGLGRTSAALGPIVRVAPGTVDLAPAVATATEPGVDGVIGFLAGGTRGTLTQQLRAAHYAGRYVTRAPWGSAASASDPDPSVSGTLVVGHFPPPTSGDQGWTQLRRDMGVNIRQAAALDEGTVNSWLAASVFEQLLESVDLTWLKTAVLEPIVYNGTGDSRGLTPALTTTATDPARPRAFNDTVTFSVTRVGAPLLLDRRFFDPYSGRFVRGPSTR
jgi:ABC-type branched-subunit amino acid transport system substrate-binding protein